MRKKDEPVRDFLFRPNSRPCTRRERTDLAGRVQAGRGWGEPQPMRRLAPGQTPAMRPVCLMFEIFAQAALTPEASPCAIALAIGGFCLLEPGARCFVIAPLMPGAWCLMPGA